MWHTCVGQKGSAAILVTRRSAGVAPVVTLRIAQCTKPKVKGSTLALNPYRRTPTTVQVRVTTNHINRTYVFQKWKNRKSGLVIYFSCSECKIYLLDQIVSRRNTAWSKILLNNRLWSSTLCCHVAELDSHPVMAWDVKLMEDHFTALWSN